MKPNQDIPNNGFGHSTDYLAVDNPLRDIDVLLFDLDNTIYPNELGLLDRVEARMTEFIMDMFQIDVATAKELRTEYYHEYGTTLRGLMNKHKVDPEAFLAYVHEIDRSHVDADHELEELLSMIPKRKVIFTNGSRRHAEHTLGKLGINHHFEDIFDITAAEYIPKPNAYPYQKICEKHNIDPKRAIMFDDIARNLLPAADIGMTTVLIESDNPRAMEFHDDERIHFHVVSVVEFIKRHFLNIS
ncbi:MAG: pyrimidine 5'-nucleotidase [Legionellales bacterium]|nr:pyrimidine 5'-nucleotidase [Legionellales bacterium]|tara:strand:+ start:23297 stop:24028 length:732 start_codon:yes stop_codon:yes gene_type:complete